MVHPRISQYRSADRTEVQSRTDHSMHMISIRLRLLSRYWRFCLHQRSSACIVSLSLRGCLSGRLSFLYVDGLVPSYVLVDAIAAEFAWPILGRFFQRTVYREIEVRKEPQGVSIWRAGLCLTDRLTDKSPTLPGWFMNGLGGPCSSEGSEGVPTGLRRDYYEPQSRNIVDAAMQQRWLAWDRRQRGRS